MPNPSLDSSNTKLKETLEEVQRGEDKNGDVCSSPLKRRRNVKADAWEWEEIEVNIGWGTLRGKAKGSGSRLILGLHGWLDNANTFDLIAPFLPEDARFLSLDLPGHGKSDHFPPGFIYDPRGYMGAVKKAVQVLGWQQFTLLCHSMGAVVGIMYSSVFPEDVEAFLSIDIIKPWSTPADQYAKQYKKYFLSYYDNEAKSEQSPLIYKEEDLVRKTMEGSNSLDEKSARIMLKRGARRSTDGEGLILTRDLRAKSYFIGFTYFDAWVEFARSIACPILLIKASDGHHYETKERYSTMLSAFEENCSFYRYVEVEGKHHIHLTHSETVGEIVSCFLEECKSVINNGANNIVT